MKGRHHEWDCPCEKCDGAMQATADAMKARENARESIMMERAKPKPKTEPRLSSLKGVRIICISDRSDKCLRECGDICHSVPRCGIDCDCDCAKHTTKCYINSSAIKIICGGGS